MLPGLPVQLAATLGLEALRYLTAFTQPVLVDSILEFDALTNMTQVYPVPVKPSCPICSKKDARHQNPDRNEIFGSERGPSRLPDLIGRLVSSRTGIVSEFAAALREPSEPPPPYVWRARLSNHRFLSGQTDAHAFCSGKGMTRAEAWDSCLGEAVERYSAGCWNTEELVIGTRSALDGESLHPAELVLYLPEQYRDLPYAPYTEASKLTWIRAKSLIDSKDVWVPAIAVFPDYQIHSQEEFLFPMSSNGLAAGPTLYDAVLSAIYEVLERDALLVAWLNRLPGRFYSAADHPDMDVRSLAFAYRRRGVSLAWPRRVVRGRMTDPERQNHGAAAELQRRVPSGYESVPA